mmetsp:Transcript_22897/g.70731  ORF Transcript_22897/g.70731 Transcript_22897/m.70731 type:complete len:359 (+) Transcript_22897:939-2015(+)
MRATWRTANGCGIGAARSWASTLSSPPASAPPRTPPSSWRCATRRRASSSSRARRSRARGTTATHPLTGMRWMPRRRRRGWWTLRCGDNQRGEDRLFFCRHLSPPPFAALAAASGLGDSPRDDARLPLLLGAPGLALRLLLAHARQHLHRHLLRLVVAGAQRLELPPLPLLLGFLVQLRGAELQHLLAQRGELGARVLGLLLGVLAAGSWLRPRLCEDGVDVRRQQRLPRGSLLCLGLGVCSLAMPRALGRRERRPGPGGRLRLGLCQPPLGRLRLCLRRRPGLGSAPRPACGCCGFGGLALLSVVEAVQEALAQRSQRRLGGVCTWHRAAAQAQHARREFPRCLRALAGREACCVRV